MSDKHVNDVVDDDQLQPEDLGKLDPAWEGFRILNGHLWTPNGYYYRPGDIYVIPIRQQQLSHLERETTIPKQMLL